MVYPYLPSTLRLLVLNIIDSNKAYVIQVVVCEYHNVCVCTHGTWASKVICSRNFHLNWFSWCTICTMYIHTYYTYYEKCNCKVEYHRSFEIFYMSVISQMFTLSQHLDNHVCLQRIILAPTSWNVQDYEKKKKQ